MSDTTANELLKMMLDDPASVNGFTFEELHTECLAGRLPSEYVRAMADRARAEKRSKRRLRDRVALELMAAQLEAWADE